MNARTYFDSETGKIITSVKGSIEFIDLSKYEQYQYIEAYGDSSFQYVQNNEIVNMPERPNVNSVFNFSTKQWENPSIDVGWQIVRNRRNIELVSCDWTQAQDVQLPNKEAWVSYRQALRDITNQSDPFNIEWPIKPE